MRTRMSRLILLVVILQMIAFVASLRFGGAFNDMEVYSYDVLVGTTTSSGTYLQNDLQKKTVTVQEYARQVNSAVADILQERDASIAGLKTDETLNRSVLQSSVELLSGLLQRAAVNEVYLILDSGDLYTDENGSAGMSALYLSAADANPDPENPGLQMVIGPSSVSQELGLTQSSGWSQYFVPDSVNSANSDFYFMAIETARENKGLAQNDLGYWSRFSAVSSAAASSMKYSLPLVAEDGTVYGVLGIGMTKDTAFSGIPEINMPKDGSCYVLACSDANGGYEILNYIGADYETLLGGASHLRIGSEGVGGIYDIEVSGASDLVGLAQGIGLYEGNSPYAGEQWALISVADRSSLLRPMQFLQRMLGVSAVMSLVIAAIVTAAGSGSIVKPLSNLSKQIKSQRKYNEVVRFQPSNIYEIDEITDAITQMQINVQGFSSQVSKMISVADVGLGTFMYDRTDDSVFVGQSLIKVLRLSLPQGEDIMMSRQDFLNSIENPEIRSPIAAGLGMGGREMRGDFSEVYQISQPSGGTFWMRLGYTYSPNTAIGIVQDITETMIEKSRIERERDYDSLTGLLNRHAYYRMIEKLFHDKSSLKITAFVMIDLDNLKYVNDTYGHDFGDDYIKTAASALQKFENYGGIVARISGDEFNICLPGFSSKEEVRKRIAEVRTELLQSSCLLADGTHFKVAASMGVSWYPDDADSYELLMKYADFAMYTIKHSTKGESAEFDISTYSADSVLLTGVAEMNRIIEERRVRYAFQSIVSAKTGEVYGYEALMRVQSSIFQSPLELLRTAKTGAKLYEIERLTWTKSLEDFQTQVDAGHIEKDAYVFINSIANNKLEAEVEAALEKQYPHLLDHIIMEILESESSDENCTAHKAQLIRKWGGQIALDDFGTGYNSEYALLTLQPGIIKIDRSIISGCNKDASRRIIIKNLVKLAREKGITVLAEGVETAEEMKTVISCGVDLLQGYYLAHPLFDPEPIAPEVVETIRHLAAEKRDENLA